jgi:hypothetical protein
MNKIDKGILKTACEGVVALLLLAGIILLITTMTGCPRTDKPGIEDNTEAVVSMTVTCSWTPPTKGPPVHHYILEVEDTAGVKFYFYTTTSKSKIKFTIDRSRVRARVAGIDADDHQGPYSEWSRWWPVRDNDGPDIDNPFDLRELR